MAVHDFFFRASLRDTRRDSPVFPTLCHRKMSYTCEIRVSTTGHDKANDCARGIFSLSSFLHTVFLVTCYPTNTQTAYEKTYCVDDPKV